MQPRAIACGSFDGHTRFSSKVKVVAEVAPYDLVRLIQLVVPRPWNDVAARFACAEELVLWLWHAYGLLPSSPIGPKCFKSEFARHCVNVYNRAGRPLDSMSSIRDIRALDVPPFLEQARDFVLVTRFGCVCELHTWLPDDSG